MSDAPNPRVSSNFNRYTESAISPFRKERLAVVGPSSSQSQVEGGTHRSTVSDSLTDEPFSGTPSAEYNATFVLASDKVEYISVQLIEWRGPSRSRRPYQGGPVSVGVKLNNDFAVGQLPLQTDATVCKGKHLGSLNL